MESENGWPVIDASVLNRQPIPGTDIVPLPGTRGGDVGWLLRWVGEQFDKRVMKLYNPGCWGWNAPVAVPGTNVYSNHSSGTAVDFNAPTFPWKTRNMSPAQRQACRDIVATTEYAVVWGGDFTTFVDEMHFEINGTSEDVARVVKKLKGGDMVTRELLDKLWAGYFDRPPMKTEYEQFVGRPVDLVIDTAWNSPEFKTRMDGLRKVVQSKAGTVNKQDVIDYMSKNLK